MEAKLDHHAETVAASKEVEEALGKGPSEIDLETKFRRLEGKAAPGESPAAAPELDDEIARLKKKIRIGS